MIKRKQSVYIIADDVSKAFKIGRAWHPESRLRELQVGNPNQLRIVDVIKNGGKRLERAMHRTYHKDRLLGEWFRYHVPGEKLDVQCRDGVIRQWTIPSV